MFIPPPVTDLMGRQFKTLRVSLTNTCNLSCTYCSSGKRRLNPTKALDYRLLTDHIIRLHALLQLQTVRFTGGEPLLYPDIVPLVEGIHQAMKTVALKITTNGFLLPQKAVALAKAGITDVNISLDALHEDVFYRLTKRKGLKKVLQGIAAAKKAGMTVKINSVIMKGLNEQEILPLLYFGHDQQIPVRYLELMPMGHLHKNDQTYFFSMREMLSVLRTAGIDFTAMGRASHGTTCYWQMANGYSFGIIANETVPFCHDCDRLRLDSTGHIYGCLSSNRPMAIVPHLDDPIRLTACLQEALSHKQMAFTGSTLSMMDVGG